MGTDVDDDPPLVAIVIVADVPSTYPVVGLNVNEDGMVNVGAESPPASTPRPYLTERYVSTRIRSVDESTELYTRISPMWPWSRWSAPALLFRPIYKSVHAAPPFCAAASGPFVVIAMPFRKLVVVFVVPLYCIVARTHWPRTVVDGAFAAMPYQDPDAPTDVANLSWYIPKYSWKSAVPVRT